PEPIPSPRPATLVISTTEGPTACATVVTACCRSCTDAGIAPSETVEPVVLVEVEPLPDELAVTARVTMSPARNTIHKGISRSWTPERRRQAHLLGRSYVG